MNLRLHILTVLLMQNLFAYSLSAIEKDSLSATAPEIKVEAGRLGILSGNKYSPVVTLDKSKIRESGYLQVSEAINTTPGVYIKNYGGTGGIKTVSLRGTTGQQTVFMLDGIRINTAQTGTVDLSVLPLFMLEGIDIVRGGSSALYGGNSMGGVINFATGIPGNKARYALNPIYGSFDEFSVSGGADFPIGQWYAGANLEFLSSKGDFPFEFNNFGKTETYHRQNSDFSNFAAMVKTGMTDTNSSLKINILSRFSERGIPGAVLQNRIGDSPDRLDEGEVLASAIYFKNLGESYYTVSLAAKAAEMNYHSPQSIGYLTENDYLEKYAYLNARYGFTLGCLVKTELQSELTFNDINYNYSGEVKDYKKRNAASLAIKAETIDFALGGFIILSIQSGLRFDAYSDSFSALSPAVSLIASEMEGNLNFRLQWSNNFRPPNFSELYYLNFGNRRLKPEKSNSYNAGITWKPFEFINLSADGFIIDTRDQIQTIPVSPVAWKASNYARVLSKGIEISVMATFFDKLLSLKLNHTLQETTDESPGSKASIIPYVPGEIFNAGITLKTGDLLLGGDVEYTGFRYSLPGNNINSILKEYFLINTFASYRITFNELSLRIRIDALNLFNKNYQVVKNYPMPGRQFRLSAYFNY
jgi:vitamin B12 transporter